MRRKINMLRSLTKPTAYAILLLLSQPAAALLILDSGEDAYGEGLSEELTTLSSIDTASQEPLVVIKDPQQAKQILRSLEKNFRETGELRDILMLAPTVSEMLPDNSNIRYMYAIALAAKGNIESAQQIINEQKKDDGSAAIYRLIAQATLAKTSGIQSEASSLAQKAISIDPSHPYPYNLLGQVEVAQQNYAKALMSFQTAVELAPKFATGWSNLGTAQFLQGDPDAAKASFSTAIKLSPDFCAPRIGRSTILSNTGYIDSAIADLEVCIKSEPRHQLANRKLAVLYLQVARLEDARKVAETLSKDDALLSKTVMADIYLRQNQPGEARKQLQGISNPDSQILYLLSFCDMLEGQSKDAIERIRQAEALMPDSATLQIASMVFAFATDKPVDSASLQQMSKDSAIGKLALFLAGNVQAASGNMKKAYDLWSEAEDLMPGFTLDGMSFNSVSTSITAAEQRSLALGVLFYLKNLYPASLSEFNKALVINDDSFLANYFSAIANAQVGNEVETVEHLKRSLQQAPEFFPANYMLAESYIQKRNIDSAIKHYQAAANSKADGGVLIKLGLLYEQENRQQDAEAAYRKFIENYADNFIGYNQLAWMFTRNGERLDEALKLAKKANELQPGNASINDTIGWIYFQKSDYTKAKKHLSQANTISKGNNADILFHLASLEYALGETENAKILVEKALATSANFESRLQAKELLTKLQN